jgi:hypothetical protein
MVRSSFATRWQLFLIVSTVCWLVARGAGCSAPAKGTPDAAHASATATAATGAGGAGGSSSATGMQGFNLMNAASAGWKKMTVTYDAPPDAGQAVDVSHYDTPGLTLSDGKLDGTTVTFVTTAQEAKSYTVTVSGVTRASDGAMLTNASAMFQGAGPFNVSGAKALKAGTLQITFDAPPDATLAGDAANYDAPGLTLTAPTLAGNVVTLTTSAQLDQTYTVTVSNVTRAADATPLDVAKADFTGRVAFDVSAAAPIDPATLTVTFSAPPNAALATTLANYTVAGLTLSGMPKLAGNTVTLKTSAQAAQTYTVVVAKVTRDGDAEPLSVDSADFSGLAPKAPTVTNVVVTGTTPDNGLVPFNTGAIKVTITGTDFATVDCAAKTKGVALDDLDGLDGQVSTSVTACTVVSDTEISATFPAGIRTNGTNGWNVIVSNAVDANLTSDVKLVPVAGLTISEVYTGTSGKTDHEFVEIYNATTKPVDTKPVAMGGIGLALHTRASTGGDTNKKLTFTSAAMGVIPAHGYLMIMSSASDAGDAWFSHGDVTYSAALVGNGGVYISLNAIDDAQVIDKCGWGAQPAGGFELTAAANIPNNQSSERKPAGGKGAGGDTDDNSKDFNAPTTMLTPKGSADTVEP